MGACLSILSLQLWRNSVASRQESVGPLYVASNTKPLVSYHSMVNFIDFPKHSDWLSARVSLIYAYSFWKKERNIFVLSWILIDHQRKFSFCTISFRVSSELLLILVQLIFMYDLLVAGCGINLSVIDAML